MKLLITILLFANIQAFAAADEAPKQFIPLTYSPTCILEAVAKRTMVQLKKEVPLPALFPHSTTNLEQFKIGARFNYPEDYVIEYYANVYSAENNALFINDSIPLVGKNGRTPDDVLAHELTHYLQSKYQGYDKEESSSDAAEESAVQVQTWFRDTYMNQQASETPCPLTKAAGLQFSNKWEWVRVPSQ